MKRLMIAAMVAAGLAGCAKEDEHSNAINPTADGDWQRDHPAPLVINNQPDRFKVERQMVFRDQLAYDGQRGVYVITDRKTGTEFLGVSGIGITEIGMHGCGKSCTREDER